MEPEEDLEMEDAHSANVPSPTGAPTDGDDMHAEGERVLAYHRELLYEAKVMKRERRIDPDTNELDYAYYLHYNGWNDRFNEWVDPSRMLKYNDDNKKILLTQRPDLPGLGYSGGISGSSAGKKRKTR